MPNRFPALLISGVEITARTPASISTFIDGCPTKTWLIVTSSTTTRSPMHRRRTRRGTIAHAFEVFQKGRAETTLCGYGQHTRFRFEQLNISFVRSSNGNCRVKDSMQ